jgi:adenine-specific DNA-methyltransferase
VSHNYNLVFCKDINYFVKNRDKFRLPESGDGFSNPDNDTRGPWKADPFQVGGWRPNQQYEIINPNTGEKYLPNENCSWKNDFEKYQELIKDKRIVFGASGDSGPLRKRFLSEALDRGKVSKTWWDDVGATTNGTNTVKKLFDGKSVFTNPKPVDLLERMIQLGDSDKNNIVLDFFSGSSTSAHAVLNLNAKDGGKRKFIQVQLPEKIEEGEVAFKLGYKKITEIGKERIKRVIHQIKNNKKVDSTNLDLGFKVFKLDSSNIKSWDGNPDNLKSSLFDSICNIKDDRTEDDILYEILIKYGLDLSLPVKERKINSKTIYNIGLGSLFICLDDDITTEVSEEIGKWKEECNPEMCRVVFKDEGLNDIIKTNSYQILKRFGIKEIKTI